MHCIFLYLPYTPLMHGTCNVGRTHKETHTYRGEVMAHRRDYKSQPVLAPTIPSPTTPPPLHYHISNFFKCNDLHCKVQCNVVSYNHVKAISFISIIFAETMIYIYYVVPESLAILIHACCNFNATTYIYGLISLLP